MKNEDDIRSIGRAVMALCDELKIDFPDVFKKSYDIAGFPILNEEPGVNFQSRMCMAIYIELMKAGAFNYLLANDE